MSENLLPYDGEALYYPGIISPGNSEPIFRELMDQIEWEHDRVRMFGKEIITKRKVAWYGDRPYTYRYSGNTKRALEFTPLLMKLKRLATTVARQEFNSCLLNLYHDGTLGMSWHRDNEKELLKDGCIASYSFGSTRKFVLRHRTTGEKAEIFLDDGSLLLMRGVIQEHWEHRLPPSKKIADPRINLTYRYITNG